MYTLNNNYKLLHGSFNTSHLYPPVDYNTNIKPYCLLLIKLKS